jgi:hypothetical protein
VVECLLCNHLVLSSNPSPNNNKKIGFKWGSACLASPEFNPQCCQKKPKAVSAKKTGKEEIYGSGNFEPFRRKCTEDGMIGFIRCF